MDPAIRAAWEQLIEEHRGANPANNWFSPLFEPLLVAAASHPVVGALYPYQRLNELCLAPEATTADLSSNTDMPAIDVLSTGRYAVLTQPGGEGEVVAELPDAAHAVERLAELLRR